MQPAGWYPDPLSPPGSYRWWDGSAWTDQTTYEPPTQPAGPGYGPPAAPAAPSPAPAPSRTPIIAGAIAIVVLLVVGVAVFLASRDGDGDDVLAGSDTTEAAEDETTTTEAEDETTTTEAEDEVGELVIAGDLGYPPLGEPWETFPPGTSPPFLEAAGQFQFIADLPDGTSWVAQILVGLIGPEVPRDQSGDLTAATGAYAEFLTTNFMTAAGATVTNEDSGPIDVDGNPGFRITREFNFSDPNIPSVGSIWIMALVDTGSPIGLSGFFAAVPVEEASNLTDAETALDTLTVP
ncbi:MAG: DUF2510 domain-containing protein [Acidimicrobiales bacterium]